jgi:hypothetical protein
MKRFTFLAMIAVFALAAPALAQSPDAGTPLFLGIAEVLQSPRCMNCHPAGEAPLQTDQSRPHKQNIKRVFASLGGSCSTCHQDAPMPGANMPPGAPHWSMPPAETPMIFQGKSPTQLCVDLKDPAKNGNRTLAQLLHHITTDPLVVWGFDPGPGRTPPPVNHASFIARFDAWIAQGALCPTP